MRCRQVSEEDEVRQQGAVTIEEQHQVLGFVGRGSQA